MNNKYIIYLLTICFCPRLQAEAQDSLALLHYNLFALSVNAADGAAPIHYREGVRGDEKKRAAAFDKEAPKVTFTAAQDIAQQRAEEELRAREAATPKIECTICAEEQSGAAFPRLTCGHDTCCAACVRTIITTAIEKRKLHDIRCPSCPQTATLPVADINKIIPRTDYAAQREALDDLEQQAWCAQQAQAKHCPTTGCSRVFLTTRGPQLITCKECEKQYCASCAQLHPAGFASCAAAAAELKRREQARANTEVKSKEDKAAEDWIKENTKPCPTCKARVHKTEGCKFITCPKCVKDFCWECGTGNLTPYSHQAHSCPIGDTDWGFDNPPRIQAPAAPAAVAELAAINAVAQQQAAAVQRAADDFFQAIRLPAGQPALRGLEDWMRHLDAQRAADEAARQKREAERQALVAEQQKVRDDLRQAREAERAARDEADEAERQVQIARHRFQAMDPRFQAAAAAGFAGAAQQVGAGVPRQAPQQGAGAAGEYKRVAAQEPEEDVTGDLNLAFEEAGDDIELQKALEESMKS